MILALVTAVAAGVGICEENGKYGINLWQLIAAVAIGLVWPIIWAFVIWDTFFGKNNLD